MERAATFWAGFFEPGVAGRTVQVVALDPLSTSRTDFWFFDGLEQRLLFQGMFVCLRQCLSRA